MAGKKPPTAFWVCLFILLVPFLGICAWQIFERVGHYLNYPVVQKSRVVTTQSQRFPSVTVCNNNPARKSRMAGTDYDSLVNTDNQVRQSLENLLGSTGSDTVSPSAAREILNTAYQDRRTAGADADLARWLRQDIAELGHQLNDFVMSCSYNNGQQCVSGDLSSVFSISQSRKYGNCFTFKPVFEVSSPGINGQGLTMTLFADVAEYVGLFGRQPGVTLTVHPPNTTAFPEDGGIAVKAGESAAIGVRKTVKKHLPAPYGNCAQGMEGEALYPGEYTTEMCRHNCLQKALLDKCLCVDDPRTTSGDICSRTEENCRSRLYEQDAAWRDNCNCKHPCTEESYVTTVTSAAWAPENVLIPGLDYVTSVPAVGANIKENVVQVQVYFQDDSYEQTEEHPGYAVRDLLRDIALDITVWLVIFLIFLGFVYLVFVAIRACCGPGSGSKAI